jgi:hypothetical protein
MKKYKISKKNLKEFFGFFTGKKKTPAEIQKLIDNDPVLQRLEKELRAINAKAEPHMNKLKDRNPELYKWAMTNFKSSD